MPAEPAPEEVLAQLAATPDALAQLTVEASAESLDVAPAGEWSARVVLAHLRDAESLEFRLGLERLLAETRPVLAFLPPEEWARDRNRERDGKRTLLGDFALQRQASLNLIAGMRADGWAREGTAPGGSALTVTAFVELWARHDADHLAQIEALLGETAAGAQARRARPLA